MHHHQPNVQYHGQVHDLLVVDHVPAHGPERLVDDDALVNLLPRPNMWLPRAYFPKKYTEGGTIHRITIPRILAARALYDAGQPPNQEILAVEEVVGGENENNEE